MDHTIPTQTMTVDLKDLSVAELVQISQGLGNQIEKLRNDRIYLKKLIDQKLAEEPVRRLEAELAAAKARVEAAS